MRLSGFMEAGWRLSESTGKVGAYDMIDNQPGRLR
jgi:hypothetical protein